MRPATITAALLAALALTLAACGEKQEGPFPLDAATVKAAVDNKAGVTSSCEFDQYALEPDSSITCPAVARTRKGLVKGQLVISREGETTDEVAYELSSPSGPVDLSRAGEARLAPAA
jgi:predicted small lipoprotein YifL